MTNVVQLSSTPQPPLSNTPIGAPQRPPQKHEVIRILSGISTFKRIPNATTEQQVNFFLEVYASRLMAKGFGLETIQKAANDILDTDKTDWFPQPAKMIEICQEYHTWAKQDYERSQPVAMIESTYSESKGPKHASQEEVDEILKQVAETKRFLGGA